MRLPRQLAIGGTCLFLSGAMALAQVITGTISGTVSDATGAVVPGARITLKNIETGIARSVTSDALGRYSAPELRLGSYEVTADAAGFQTTVRSGIALTVGRAAVVDFTLAVGSVAESVTVSGEAPLVETTNGTVATLVDAATMRDLPLNGRSFADLTSIQPGVVSDMEITAVGAQSVYTGGGAAARRSIGGAKPSQSTYLLDGMEISTPSEGMPVASVLGQQLGVDAIREFTLLQSNYGAQYGRAVGGVVNAVTQSGTNSFHGSAFEFLRNQALDARDYFLSPTQSKAPLRRNQFGGSFGGPLQKDRTFFFVNYEGLRQSAGISYLGATLTPETRLGRITACPVGRNTCSRAESIVTSTLAVNPDVVPVMNLLPLPNGNYRNAGVADRFSTPMWHADENYGIVRMDRQLSSKDSLFGRLTVDRSARTDSLELLTPKPFTGFQVGGYIVAAVSETRIISPSLLNTLRLGFTRRNDHLFYNYSQGGDQFPAAPGLDPRLSPVKGVPLGLYNIAGVNMYAMSSNGSTVGPNLSGPAVFVDNTFDYDDSLIFNHGPHSITAGVDLKRYRMNELNEPWVYGQFSWQTIERLITNQPFNDTQLVGFSSPGTQIADVYRGWRQTYVSAFVQDDLKLRSNLTLNLGLRWEQISSPREVNGKLAVLKDVFRDKQFTPLSKGDALFEIRDGLKGFSPRIGFAWTPFSNQKTVFRGGFGAFKEVPLEYIYQLAIEAPPFSKRFTVNAPALKFPFPFADANLAASTGEPLMMPLSFKEPYTVQWTFALERQMGQTLVVKLNYIGTHGINQVAINNPNQPLTTVVNGRQFTPATAQVPNPSFTSYRYVNSIIDQFYHAGQVVVEKRLGSGLRLNGSYSWSKNIDTGGGAGLKGAEQIVGGASFAVYNSYDLAGERGLTALDIRHNFIASYTYELPFGSGRRWGTQWKGITNELLGGWMLNGTNTWRSGLPINLGMTPRQSRCAAQSCNERPDVRPGGNHNPVRKNWRPESYFDPSQFIVPTVGFFGNVGRDTLIRPGQFNWNFSLAKSNRLGEQKNLEFRAEFFNLLNHPNFGSPTGNVFRNAAGDFDPNVGRITTTSIPMRQIQFGLKLTF